MHAHIHNWCLSIRHVKEYDNRWEVWFRVLVLLSATMTLEVTCNAYCRRGKLFSGCSCLFMWRMSRERCLEGFMHLPYSDESRLSHFASFAMASVSFGYPWPLRWLFRPVIIFHTNQGYMTYRNLCPCFSWLSLHALNISCLPSWTTPVQLIFKPYCKQHRHCRQDDDAGWHSWLAFGC